MSIVSEKKFLTEEEKNSLKEIQTNTQALIAELGEIELIKKDGYDRYHLTNLIEWWKNKAQNRFQKLKDESRIRTEIEIYTPETIEAGKIDMVR